MQAAIDRAHSAALNHHLAAIEQQAAVNAAAHRQLRDAFITALLADPQTAVATPAWNVPAETVAYVIKDGFDDKTGDASLLELLRIVAMCAEGKSGPELHLRASAWIAQQAAEYADFHVGDLVEQMGDGA